MYRNIVFCSFMSFLVCGCANFGCNKSSNFEFSGDSDNILLNAKRHEYILKQHFVHNRSFDVSKLIEKTMQIAEDLKYNGYHEHAVKFYSYCDVLIYGNEAIEESIADVLKLKQSKDNVDSNYGYNKSDKYSKIMSDLQRSGYSVKPALGNKKNIINNGIVKKSIKDNFNSSVVPDSRNRSKNVNFLNENKNISCSCKYKINFVN